MPTNNYSNLGVTVPKGSDSPPDVPSAFEDFADSFGAGQTAGKLLVVQSTGAAAWKAMSGDATIDKDGVLQLGTGSVGANELAAKVVTAAKLGTLPAARAKRDAAAQAVPDKTFSAVSFNAEVFDTDTIHDNATNPSRLTCRTPGLYSIYSYAVFAGNSTGIRTCSLRVNGSVFVAEESCPGQSAPEAGAGGNAFSPGTLYRLNENDYVELVMWQNSGGLLNVMSGDGIHVPALAMAFQSA